MKNMKMIVVLVAAGFLLVPTSGFAQDNLSFLESTKGQVRTLSSQESANVQGASWSIVRQLMVQNVKIYGRVGWEIGRMISIRQYKIDPGPYPGLTAALLGRF